MEYWNLNNGINSNQNQKQKPKKLLFILLDFIW